MNAFCKVSVMVLMMVASSIMSGCDSSKITLKWYLGCNRLPTCPGGGAQVVDVVNACTTEQEGQPCETEGATCDPGLPCENLLICASSDPTQGGLACPL